MRILLVSDNPSERGLQLFEKDSVRFVKADLEECPKEEIQEISEPVLCYLRELSDCDAVVFDLSEDQKIDNYVKWAQKSNLNFEHIISAAVLRPHFCIQQEGSDNEYLSNFLDSVKTRME